MRRASSADSAFVVGGLGGVGDADLSNFGGSFGDRSWIMKKTMETTVLCRGYIGVISLLENKMETAI